MDWIACSERMPEPYTRVLAYFTGPASGEIPHYANAPIIARRAQFTDGFTFTRWSYWWVTDDNGEWQDWYVSHWMPLPAPPVPQTTPQEATHAD